MQSSNASGNDRTRCPHNKRFLNIVYDITADMYCIQIIGAYKTPIVTIASILALSRKPQRPPNFFSMSAFIPCVCRAMASAHNMHLCVERRAFLIKWPLVDRSMGATIKDSAAIYSSDRYLFYIFMQYFPRFLSPSSWIHYQTVINTQHWCNVGGICLHTQTL